jgi:hypothetical protein
MLILVAFGFWHARRVREDEELHVHDDHLVVKSEVTNGHGKVLEPAGS